MATLLSAIEASARNHLVEATASYWTSAELIDIINRGIRDLWRAVNDLKLNYFCTVDTTNVSVAANATTLTGVPADCVRVHMLEPRVLTASGYGLLKFEPKDYNSPEFQGARSQTALEPGNGGIVYWVQTGAGGPVAAPTVLVAPKLSADVNLALTYVPTLAALTAASANPIPGESDNALICWCVAYARAKEREDRSPDPGWLQLYATEKSNILASLAPRQDQEAETVRAIFSEYWG